MATATMMEVPESQRLIALSLGKIAASRGQKGGINLHKNLLVATVLTKARAAYMIQHMNAAKQQRVAATTTTTTTTTSQPSSSSTCVEMKEAKPEPTSAAGSSTTTTTTSTTSSATSPVAAAPTTSLHSSPAPAPAAPQSVTPQAEAASVPEGAAGSRMQVAEIEDKENTPPPSSPCRGDANSPSSLDCEKRLQGDPCVDIVKEGKPALSSRAPVSHGQHSNNTTTTNTRDYVSRPSSTCCLLKRRRAMDRDHENVSAPKVRIVEARVSDSTAATTTTTTTEPMQCDSPQISNLVNIFNTSFSGLSGASGTSGEVSVRSVGQSILSSVSTSHHKLSDSNNLTCAKEMTKVGLDSLHHPLVLSV